jgi:hypothetical protein
MAGVPAEQQAADDTVTFSEWMDLFAESVVSRTFAATTPLPSDEEIADYCIRFARGMKPEATDGEMFVLTVKLGDMITRARQTLRDGNLAVLQHIHGSQTGGGKGTKLKVPESERGNLNAALVEEFNGFIDKQTKIKNELAQKKISKEVSIIYPFSMPPA